MKYLILFIFSISFFNVSAQADKVVLKQKNINYVSPSNEDYAPAKHTLDVYFPADVKGADVVIFIHGGSWKSGKKDTYNRIGNNFAKKGVVFVSINYRLSPQVKYDEMAYDCARAIDWVAKTIDQYNGNPNRIFVSGHSAGGHLAALVSMNEEFFQKAGVKNSIRGVILNDAFGLDLVNYFQKTDSIHASAFYPPFSTDAYSWQLATPLTYTQYSNLPFLIMTGEKTYPSIIEGSNLLTSMLEKEQKKVQHISLKGKRHIGMISQMYWKNNAVYGFMMDFMKAN